MMLHRRRVWCWGVTTLLLVWLVAGLAIWLLREQRMTPEKIVLYLKEHPLNGLSASERQHVISAAADWVSRLSFEDRQRIRNDRELRRWLEQLTESERRYYIETTWPKGVQQTMKAFNAMPAQRRKRLVQRALVDMERLRTEMDNADLLLAFSDDTVRRLVEEGLNHFYQEASDEAQLDLQPLIEQIQHLLQMGR